MAVTGSMALNAGISHTGTAELTTPVESLGALLTWAITSGTGANQMNILYTDRRTLALSTSEELDLAGGVVDRFGTTLTFSKIKFIAVLAATANGGLIQVGGASSNGFVNWVASATDIVQVRAGGALLLVAPDSTAYAVTGGTGDLLKIANTDGAAGATYDIVIGGVSA